MPATPRPVWWNALHDRYLARLTSDWQDLRDLKFAPTDGDRGYFDLVSCGAAKEQRTPILRHGIASGETICYRLLARDGEA